MAGEEKREPEVGKSAAPELRLLDRRAFVAFPPLDMLPGCASRLRASNSRRHLPLQRQRRRPALPEEDAAIRLPRGVPGRRAPAARGAGGGLWRARAAGRPAHLPHRLPRGPGAPARAGRRLGHLQGGLRRARGAAGRLPLRRPPLRLLPHAGGGGASASLPLGAGGPPPSRRGAPRHEWLFRPRPSGAGAGGGRHPRLPRPHAGRRPPHRPRRLGHSRSACASPPPAFRPRPSSTRSSSWRWRARAPSPRPRPWWPRAGSRTRGTPTCAVPSPRTRTPLRWSACSAAGGGPRRARVGAGRCRGGGQSGAPTAPPPCGWKPWCANGAARRRAPPSAGWPWSALGPQARGETSARRPPPRLRPGWPRARRRKWRSARCTGCWGSARTTCPRSRRWPGPRTPEDRAGRHSRLPPTFCAGAGPDASRPRPTSSWRGSRR